MKKNSDVLDNTVSDMTTRQYHLFDFVLILAALAVMIFCGGCGTLAQYDRTYSFSAQDERGREISASLHLEPLRGLSK